jgi:hypothetical protein
LREYEWVLVIRETRARAPAPHRHHRPGRRSHVQLLRQHHDAERFVLSLRELREYERVQLVS